MQLRLQVSMTDIEEIIWVIHTISPVTDPTVMVDMATDQLTAATVDMVMTAATVVMVMVTTATEVAAMVALAMTIMVMETMAMPFTVIEVPAMEDKDIVDIAVKVIETIDIMAALATEVQAMEALAVKTNLRPSGPMTPWRSSETTVRITASARRSIKLHMDPMVCKHPSLRASQVRPLEVTPMCLDL